MKVLVQDPRTEKYLTGEGRWSTVIRKARDFETPLVAATVARHAMTGAFRVVLYSPNQPAQAAAASRRPPVRIEDWRRPAGARGNRDRV